MLIFEGEKFVYVVFYVVFYVFKIYIDKNKLLFLK